MPSLNAKFKNRNLQRLRRTPKFPISVAVGHCSRQQGECRSTPSHQRTHVQAFWFALLPTSRNFIVDSETPSATSSTSTGRRLVCGDIQPAESNRFPFFKSESRPLENSNLKFSSLVMKFSFQVKTNAFHFFYVTVF
ncbi:hypothetical protein GHT06_016099 [Daphnia sinensis]|uniref:Uncharacterized protein n=1 Tax=Daphnia sinensis TaxID=1820382 RepID=A0AAD5LCD1_9CRUS|nr:hypothetical protein GHT06_016099 [Daphnia sinensis]